VVAGSNPVSPTLSARLIEVGPELLVDFAAEESGKDVRQLSDQHDDHHDGAIEDQSENGYP
jgi:hypothetical protein